MRKYRILIVLMICCMAGVSCSGSGTSGLVGNNASQTTIENSTALGKTPGSSDIAEQVLSITPPSGVDTELFAELQNELSRQVSMKSGKELSAHPPTGKANTIGDLMFDGQELSWTYSNAGDYDLNGEVNGSDITPIVIHFGKTPDSADWSIAAAADGDGNGEVNQSDISPIAQNFGASVSGYVVLGSESENDYPDELTGDDGVGTQVLGEVDLAGIVGDATGRQMLSITPTTQLAGNLYWVRPVLNEQTGAASYPSTSIGEGLDFQVKRLDDFNLHDPTLDDSFIVIPSRTADEITLDVWTTDTHAEEYVAFKILPDLTGFSVTDTRLTFDFGDDDTFPSEVIDFQTEIGAMVKHLAEPLIHYGPLARFAFHFDPYYASPPGFSVGTTPVNVIYASDYSSDTFELEGFTVDKPDAQSGQPARFTMYSVFMTGDGDDNGIVNRFDLKQMVFQGTFSASTSDSDFAPAGTDYDSNNYIGMSDMTAVAVHYYEAVDTIEILIWDTGEYADEAPAMTFGFLDGTPSKRHDTYPFAATTDWRDVFRTWDGEITIDMMQAADLNADGEVLVSARLRYEDQLGLPFAGIPFTYSE